MMRRTVKMHSAREGIGRRPRSGRRAAVRVRVALLLASLLVFGLATLHWWLVDGLDGALLGVLLEEDTVYAAGYSAAGWRRVQGAHWPVLASDTSRAVM